MPKLGHYLRAYLLLGEPKAGTVWLSLSCTQGHGVPLGPFVQVPERVERWEDVEVLLNQLTAVDQIVPSLDRRYPFGFLLDMIIGDAAKSKQATIHRHIGLALSMKYDTNLKLGDFTCLCANSLGLRMHRLPDRPRKENKPHGFYEWVSQSSPLIDWICNIALGLRDDELTTYDPIRANWVLASPKDFRIGLVQGLAESDGSPNVANQSVEFWIGPNWDLMISLLATLGLRAFRSRDAVVIVKAQAIKSFEIPIFSNILRTVRYARLEKLAKARRLDKVERLSEELRNEIGQLKLQGLSVPAIIEKIVDKYGILVSYEAAQRWVAKVSRPRLDYSGS